MMKLMLIQYHWLTFKLLTNQQTEGIEKKTEIHRALHIYTIYLHNTEFILHFYIVNIIYFMQF